VQKFIKAFEKMELSYQRKHELSLDVSELLKITKTF
jgi:hypothetical protein